MPFQRSSGVLLHPTSLPSQFGIGDLGQSAYQFIDFLAKSGQKLWQVLPLGPTGYGNSPYMSYSAIAGNHLLISPELLVEQNLLTEADFEDVPEFAADIVEFDRAILYKMQLLQIAYDRFQDRLKHQHNHEYGQFCLEEAKWLDDYALFMALVEENPSVTWNNWDKAIAHRQPEVIREQTEVLRDRIAFHKFLQFQFFQQWLALKKYANDQNIQIIGDIPIYVSHHSADVWANPENFALDPDTFEVDMMAGVPPDYFSETGQLWGNPVYNWEYLQETEFAWWIERFKFLHRYVDLIRIDHFRGFEAFWQVPSGELTAINGEWQKAPGVELFERLKEVLGSLPIMAEDLGIMTTEVEELRDRFEFPGMRVLLFSFGGGPDNFHLPHHYPKNSVVYTGTHDNDTAVGWWRRASKYERELFHKYIVGYAAGEEINWVLIRLAMASVSNQAIIPLQDILGLDNSARMNIPGTSSGNWDWRFNDLEILSEQLSDRLLEVTRLYSR
ncbi:4-alpha-glucanotransferase [Tumidithrix helvetica PCC 7403]|uniref:4-alpha-glucanotransferase n=1 Tax=Tumidithrix helvetica TaxID=3457545 RepID=UPI003C871903